MKKSSLDRTSKAEVLMDQATAALREHEFDRALELGAKLQELKYSGSFEVIARAQYGQGKLGEAIATLQEGVEKASDVWILWGLLGDMLQEAKRFADAHTAFENALNCPNAETGALSHSHAKLFFTERRFEEALPLAETAVRLDGARTAPALLVDTLHALERSDEAIERGLAFLTSLPAQHPGLAPLHSALARIYYRARDDRSSASGHAHEALMLDRFDPVAAWVLRSMRGRTSPTAASMRVKVRGQLPAHMAEGRTSQFLALFHVVAESPEQALEFCRSFEPEGVRETLTIESVTVGELRPEHSLGVYEVTSRVLFPAVAREVA